MAGWRTSSRSRHKLSRRRQQLELMRRSFHHHHEIGPIESVETDIETDYNYFRAPPGILSPEKVSNALSAELPNESPSCIEFLTRLFYAIGSSDWLQQLADAVQLARQTPMTHFGPSSHSAVHLSRAFDELDATTGLAHILRRYYLVELLQHRMRRELERSREKYSPPKRKTTLKYDTSRIDLLRNGEDPELEAIDSSNQSIGFRTGRKPRADSSALTDLMTVLYPNLGTANTKEENEYARKRRKLRSRLACARNWYNFQEKFSAGILALIPCGGEFGISIHQYVDNGTFQ